MHRALLLVLALSPCMVTVPAAGAQSSECSAAEGNFKRTIGADRTVLYGVDGVLSKDLSLLFFWRAVDPTHYLIGLRPRAGVQPHANCRQIAFISSVGSLQWQGIELSQKADLAGFIPYSLAALSGSEFGVDVCGVRYSVDRALGCGLHKMAAAIAATERGVALDAVSEPPLATSSQEAAPTSSLSLNAGEPFGIALKGGAPLYRLSWQIGGRTAPGNLKILWGAQLSTVEQLMGPPPRSGSSPVERPMHCFPASSGGGQSCSTHPDAPWYVDFGDAPVGTVTPYIRFTADGRFYAYNATFSTDAFATIQQILTKRLGKPTTDTPGTVQNRMGATFQQEMVTWLLPHVRIDLIQRGTDINSGLLSGTYLPIEASLPPAPEGKAPM
jgi:hypothetical protein